MTVPLMIDSLVYTAGSPIPPPPPVTLAYPSTEHSAQYYDSGNPNHRHHNNPSPDCHTLPSTLMILLLLALLAFQSKPIKDDPRDARVQDWCSGIDGEVIDAYRDYPELGDMIKAIAGRSRQDRDGASCRTTLTAKTSTSSAMI